MLRMTDHSRIRSRQRSIDEEVVELARRYGHRSYSHGDTVYEIRDRSLLGTPFERDADRLRGATVVLTSDGSVRTVMWAYRLRHRPGLLRRQRLLAQA